MPVTSNLYSHLKMHYQCEYQAVRPNRKGPKGKGKASSSKAREGTIQELFRLATKLHPDSCEQKQITKAITYHLAKDMHPVHSVERPGFRRMVNRLNPRYVLPGRNFSAVSLFVAFILRSERRLSES